MDDTGMFWLNVTNTQIENLHLSFHFIYGNSIGIFQERLRIVQFIVNVWLYGLVLAHYVVQYLFNNEF